MSGGTNRAPGAHASGLDAQVEVQASWIAYVDDFKLLMLLPLAVMPLLLIIKTPTTQANEETAPVME